MIIVVTLDILQKKLNFCGSFFVDFQYVNQYAY